MVMVLLNWNHTRLTLNPNLQIHLDQATSSQMSRTLTTPINLLPLNNQSSRIVTRRR
ncbi:hypothetical protein BT96DRAFT_917964 [Gymnopus androsaceus JB14]|uniref:Uncharacterized protein n=1 Tax=Gymnopus androsaceus JB14 TaxID=1447944 RepID=A0A6A4I1U9_9AGAR|nr:hypothetical protein BT96DRAFT_917964 [Gymnopus androsaceus JB14]